MEPPEGIEPYSARLGGPATHLVLGRFVLTGLTPDCLLLSPEDRFWLRMVGFEPTTYGL